MLWLWTALQGSVQAKGRQASILQRLLPEAKSAAIDFDLFFYCSFNFPSIVIFSVLMYSFIGSSILFKSSFVTGCP